MIPIGGRRLRIFPWVVYSLIVANIVVFVRELGVPNPDAFINS